MNLLFFLYGEVWKKRMLYERRVLQVMSIDCKTYMYHVIFIFVFSFIFAFLTH